MNRKATKAVQNRVMLDMYGDLKTAEERDAVKSNPKFRRICRAARRIQLAKRRSQNPKLKISRREERLADRGPIKL